MIVFAYIAGYIVIGVFASAILSMCGYVFIDDEPFGEFLFGMLWPLTIIALILIGLCKLYSLLVSLIVDGLTWLGRHICEIFNKRNRRIKR